MKNTEICSAEKTFMEWASKEFCGVNPIDEDGIRYGVPLGTPTVKELIAILSKLPENYRVSCCGGESYLYSWPEQESITIDTEWYLG